MNFNQIKTNDMYVVYIHEYGKKGPEIACLFRHRENAEAYLQHMKNNYSSHPIYVIKHIKTDF